MNSKFLKQSIVLVALLLFGTGFVFGVHASGSQSYPINVNYCDGSSIEIYPYSLVNAGTEGQFDCYNVQVTPIQDGYRYAFEDQSDNDYNDVIIDVWVTGKGTSSPVAHLKYVSSDAGFTHWVHIVFNGGAQLVFKVEESVPGTVFDFPLPVRECPEFNIDAAPETRTVSPGDSTEYTVSVGITDGYESGGAVNLSVTGLPFGATGTFNPNPMNGSGQSTLKVTTGNDTPAGSYTLTITGQSGEITDTDTVTLVVEDTGPQPDFSIVPNPSSREIVKGESTSYEVILTPQNGFASAVNFSVTGLPDSIGKTFTVNPVVPNPEGPSSYTTTLNITTSAATPAGLYAFTIKGEANDGQLTHSVQVTLKVKDVPPDPDFAIAATPSSQEIEQGQSTEYDIAVTPLNGFDTPVNLTVTGLPADASGTFTVNPLGRAVQTVHNAKLNITTAATTPAGQYTLTITGEGGGKTHSATVVLKITEGDAPEPDFEISVEPAERTIYPGETTTYQIDLTALNGYTNKLFLSIDGLPSGAKATFNPEYADPDGEAEVTITTKENTPIGEFPLTIKAKRGGKEHTAAVTLKIEELPPEPDFEIRAQPTIRTVHPGIGTEYTISLVPVNEFAGAVNFSVGELPSGITAAFTAGTLTAAGDTRLQVATTNDAPRGTHTITVTAVSGELTHSVDVKLSVICPDYSVKIKVDNVVGAAPLPVRFESKIDHPKNYNQNQYKYHWNFGDDTVSEEINPEHTFQSPGTYNVVLSVTDPCGRTKTAAKTIDVDIFEGALTTAFSKTKALPGDELFIDIQATNSTRRAFSNISIWDDISSKFEYISDDSGVVPTIAGNRLTWNIPMLGSGQTRSIKVKVKVKNDAAPGTATNVAYMSHESLGAGETVTSNTASLTIEGITVTLDKQVEQTTAQPGDTLTYRIILNNPSAAQLTNAKLADILSSKLEYVSQVNNSGLRFTVNGNELRWRGTVPARKQIVAVITAKVKHDVVSGTRIENKAKFEADQLPTDIFSPMVETTISTQPVSVTSVRFTKRSELPQAEIGRVVRFNITVANQSTSPLIAPVIEDYLPQGFSYVANSTLINGQKFAEPNGSRRLLWQLPDIKSNETLVIRYQVVIGADAKRGKNTNRAILRTTDNSGQSLVYEASAFVNIASSSVIFYSQLEGTVYHDKDSDSFYSMTDKPLQGIEVRLSTGEKAVTDSMGRFRFDNLNPGEYAVGVNPSTLPPDYHLANPYPKPVVLSDGLADDVEFPVKSTTQVQNKTARLEGRVYFDKNRNMSYQDSDALVKDFKAELVGVSRTAGRGGKFVFTRLEPGTYIVKIFYDNKMVEKQIDLKEGKNFLDVPLKFTGIRIMLRGNGAGPAGNQ